MCLSSAFWRRCYLSGDRALEVKAGDGGVREGLFGEEPRNKVGPWGRGPVSPCPGLWGSGQLDRHAPVPGGESGNGTAQDGWHGSGDWTGGALGSAGSTARKQEFLGGAPLARWSSRKCVVGFRHRARGPDLRATRVHSDSVPFFGRPPCLLRRRCEGRGDGLLLSARCGGLLCCQACRRAAAAAGSPPQSASGG